MRGRRTVKIGPSDWYNGNNVLEKESVYTTSAMHTGPSMVDLVRLLQRARPPSDRSSVFHGCGYDGAAAT